MLDLPDVPRWIEAHGIAADPASWRRTIDGGLAVGSDRARLMVAAGDVGDAAIVKLAREHPGHTLLLPAEREDLIAVLRDVRRIERAILHTLPSPDELPELDGASPLPPDAELAHLPAPLAEELGAARSDRTIWTAWVDGVPVSFAYAPWRSTAWFDVSVDTLAGARQLGLATLVAAAMIRDERAQGREPVWGADESNTASLRLAHRLGFVAVDEIWVAAGA